MNVAVRREDALFWPKVWEALKRLIALMIFLAAHFVLNKAFAFVVPINMTGALVLTQDVIFVIFLLVYAYLGWDMVCVFIPWLRREAYPVGQESARESGPDTAGVH